MAVHRGLTADQRREQRRGQLIEAAFDTIAEQGVNNLRVRAVSASAGLNDRYFYESFRDCHELLIATFEDQFSRALTGIMATVAESPHELEARARAVIEFAFGFIDEDPRRPRLLIELQTAEALAGRRDEVIDVLTQVMVGQVRALLGAAAGTDDNVMLTALTVVGGLLELITQWYRREIKVSRPQLIEFMTALVVTTTDIAGALERRLTAEDL
ncbi:TetR family transcriptional regulator [Mycobacterium sp. 852002-53434_SCH5985345]|uniref:TetR/AcrR family transcriptional regulator n=1 Tax=unclassified Mycobacterium TaxID=2642494 RepID=UPI0007FE3CFA|nr:MULTISPECIES: TetR/AcrR family transcriptional regulator [unclassified Mycobacterium]OBF57314.1 TetR family transcriptional regulator [Mycobacterium sp. 852002-53434_SCH5985345]OBF70013.1 TetR family transcriptional regulator [Mycobacterium sp. 852002-51613_SCH5001154]OBF95649.1 TetR family transcriptional regulator [Mycobacterium sp. 852014-52450_SCH5900713]